MLLLYGSTRRTTFGPWSLPQMVSVWGISLQNMIKYRECFCGSRQLQTQHKHIRLSFGKMEPSWLHHRSPHLISMKCFFKLYKVRSFSVHSALLPFTQLLSIHLFVVLLFLTPSRSWPLFWLLTVSIKLSLSKRLERATGSDLNTAAYSVVSDKTCSDAMSCRGGGGGHSRVMTDNWSHSNEDTKEKAEIMLAN